MQKEREEYLTTVKRYGDNDTVGHVQCELCKEIVELKGYNYPFYALYQKHGSLLAMMRGFACENCFNKEHDSPCGEVLK